MSSPRRKMILTGTFLLSFQAFEALPSCAQQAALKTDSSAAMFNRDNFVGEDACRTCHSEKFASYQSTAHHLTSQRTTKNAVLGSFVEGENILKTSDAALHFRMDAKPDGLYQTAVWGIPPATVTRSEKMDVIIGSGRKGQSYLFWKDDHLLQLPVSYWTDLHTWINSPGYRDGEANFERRVISNCFGCHLTYATAIGSPVLSNRFEKASLVMGISCERCHGPARQHVNAMMAKKIETKIINPAKLPRDNQVNVCAQCHGGLRAPLADPFTYTPGDSLDKYFRKDPASPSTTAAVHGNQVALLQLSRCYQSSANMSCSTCHDVHQSQRDAAEFSPRCLTCHRVESCGEFPKLHEKIAANCVTCHMPVQSSNVIISNLNGKPTHAQVRSHWIKVYPDARRFSAKVGLALILFVLNCC